MYAINNTAHAPSVKVTAIRVLDDYRLWMRFNNGDEKIYDFKPELKYPAFKPLADKDMFDSVYLYIGAPTWNDGKIDFSPDSLYINGTPFPEGSLSPDDLAKPVLDRDMWYEDDYYKWSVLSSQMNDDEYMAFWKIHDQKYRAAKQQSLNSQIKN